MAVGRKIRVLIVDDSPLQREILARGLNADPEIEVVARAGDAYEARDQILAHRPDVMTCDIQMPKMNGIDFIRQLIPQYALPVIVVSAVSEKVFDAMEAGAVDFVSKPVGNTAESRADFLEELRRKIKIAANAKIEAGMPKAAAAKGFEAPATNDRRLIVIGASTGGTDAIFSVLKGLPKGLPGIMVVQHIPPVFSRMFAERLNSQLEFDVKEEEDGDYLAPNRVLLAPGGMHLRLRKVGARYRADVADGEKVNGHCPSVDVLFHSVAKFAGDKAIGIILTGMGGDGGKGLLAMRQAGARTLGQDEKSSVVYGMPKIAYQLGAVERQASLAGMPAAILQMLKEDRKV